MKIPISIFIIITFISNHTFAVEYPVPGSRGVDWDLVKQKVENYDWARDIVDDLKSNVAQAQKHFDHPVLGITGWYHEYFCEDDATRLTFDPTQPKKHVCPTCQRVYSGPPYDDCWRSSVHGVVMGAMEDAAVLWRITGDDKWADYAKEQMLWYAEHFDEFEVHGEHAGKGRIMPQSLDEATHLVKVLTAYWDICEYLSQEERRTIAEKWFLEDASFIHQQTNRIHNIQSWHNAAVGLAGFALGNDELVEKAIDGSYGMKQQIQQGVKEDGFWYEGSISYHFYTMSSLAPLYLAARAQGYDLSGTDKFQKMYSAPVQFTFSNGEFPANNDGWPRQNLAERTPYYEMAAGVWDDPLFKQTLTNLYQTQSRSTKSALLYGPVDLPGNERVERKSVLFEDSGIAFLCDNGTEAYLKYGPYGGGHDHHDRLNFILFDHDEVIIPDMGTPGYGIALNNAWYRTSAAHNMLVVDGKRQKACGGYLQNYNDTKNSVRAGVSDAYEGVDIRRDIQVKQDNVVDKVWTKSDDAHQYDLFYHIRGRLETNDLPFERIEPFKQKNGYDQLRDLKMLHVDQSVSLSYSLRDTDGILTIQCSSQEPFELVVGTCPDLPANLTMSVIMLRKRGNESAWDNVIEISNE